MEDSEVRRQFERMDRKFGQVDVRFDKVDAKFADVDARFDKVDARFGEVDARFGEGNARFDKVDERFTEVGARFEKMERLIREEGERTRGHFEVVAGDLKDRIQVVAEDLKGRIQLVAEGYGAMRGGLIELKEGQQRLERGQGQLQVHILALDTRVTSVEKAQKVVLTEVRGVATKVDRMTPLRRPSRRRG